MFIAKIVIPNFVCVVQMKDTKHIRRDYSVTLVMPQGWDFGYWGCPGGVQKIKHGHVAYEIDGADEQNKIQNASKIFILGSNW